MAKTCASRKAKGRRLTQYIVERILYYFPFLTDKDVRSVPTGVPGADIWLSPNASEALPFNIEAKNQEKLNIWAALEQSEKQNRNEGLNPIVVFKRNQSDIYCCLKLEVMLSLLRNLNSSINIIKETRINNDKATS